MVANYRSAANIEEDVDSFLTKGSYRASMLATFDALLAQPILLLAVLGVGAAIGIGVEKFYGSFELERRRAYWRGRNSKRRNGEVIPIRPDTSRETNTAAEQLRCVMEAQFQPRPLLNAKELPVLACLDRALADESPGWRAMAQVSLGEILTSKSIDAFLAINSKRVDFLIVDAECRPISALEYHGSGHHLGKTAAARDAVKQEALRKARIGYEVILAGDRPSELRAMIRKLAERNASRVA